MGVIRDTKIKLGSFKARRAGRGLVATLPQSWVDDVGITKESSLDIYRDNHDRLVIIAPKAPAKDGCE
jgi:hypothetical protein